MSDTAESWNVLEDKACKQRILYKFYVGDDGSYKMTWTDLIAIYQEHLQKNDIGQKWKSLNAGT